MNKKSRLIISIIIELFITVSMVIMHNYLAMAGWGLYMFSNTGLLMYYFVEQKNKESWNNAFERFNNMYPDFPYSLSHQEWIKANFENPTKIDKEISVLKRELKKARIVTVEIGVKTYFYPQIQRPFFVMFKKWSSIAHVFINEGRVHWYKSLGTLDEAKKILKNYEELYGEKLDLLPMYTQQ